MYSEEEYKDWVDRMERKRYFEENPENEDEVEEDVGLMNPSIRQLVEARILLDRNLPATKHRAQFRSKFGNPNANLTLSREKCNKCHDGMFCYIDGTGRCGTCLLSKTKCSLLEPFSRSQREAHGKVDNEKEKLGSGWTKRRILDEEWERESKPSIPPSNTSTTESQLGNSDSDSEYHDATSTRHGTRTTRNQAVVLKHTAKRRKIIQGPSTLPVTSTLSEPPPAPVQAASSKNSETTLKAVELASDNIYSEDGFEIELEGIAPSNKDELMTYKPESEVKGKGKRVAKRSPEERLSKTPRAAEMVETTFTVAKKDPLRERAERLLARVMEDTLEYVKERDGGGIVEKLIARGFGDLREAMALL